jgi:arylsulfatase A-like enzyme
MKYYTILISALLCCLSGFAQDKVKTAPSQKMNIIFILADDLGYRDLGYTGSKYYETPNIDRLAKSAMIFDNGYAACQVCSPSRASIFTGKFPARHGITDWIGAKSGESWKSADRYTKLIPADYEHELASQYLTLPEALKEEGYKTFFAGKWHLGSKGSWPEDHGFDINVGGWDVGSPKGGYFSPFENPNLKDVKDGENLEMRLANETVGFLKSSRDSNQPVFAFLSFYAVHGPLETTQEKWKKYRDKAERMGIAEKGFKMGKFLPMRQSQDNPVFAGLVESMDDAVGVVLRALDELKMTENTIVIFTSDNGGVSAGDAFSTSNLPLRGGKGYQFEGGIREPYLIKVPGITTGKTCSVPVIGTDFYPTLLDLAGAKLRPAEHQDGESLLPLLKGNMIKTRSLVWHYPHYGNQGGDPTSIIREGDWKLIHYYEDGHEELYNLSKDRPETNDVSKENPKLVQKLHDGLFSYLKSVNAKYPVKDPQYNAELEKQYLIKVKNVQLPALEKKRAQMLSKDFDPQNNWYGSEPTKD